MRHVIVFQKAFYIIGKAEGELFNCHMINVFSAHAAKLYYRITENYIMDINNNEIIDACNIRSFLCKWRHGRNRFEN